MAPNRFETGRISLTARTELESSEFLLQHSMASKTVFWGPTQLGSSPAVAGKGKCSIRNGFFDTVGGAAQDGAHCSFSLFDQLMERGSPYEPQRRLRSWRPRQGSIPRIVAKRETGRQMREQGAGSSFSVVSVSTSESLACRPNSDKASCGQNEER